MGAVLPEDAGGMHTAGVVKLYADVYIGFCRCCVGHRKIASEEQVFLYIIAHETVAVKRVGRKYTNKYSMFALQASQNVVCCSMKELMFL
jgi:hypothetical protein